MTEQTATLTNSGSFRHIVSIRLKESGKDKVLAAIRSLEKLDFVRSASPSYYCEFSSAQSVYGPYEQYALERIQATEAQALAVDGESVRIGIIDSGIAEHPDLSANIVQGYDFFHDNVITSDDMKEHGSHVAGIVKNVYPNVALVPLQVHNNGNPDLEATISAIGYAQTHCIPIINCSFGVSVETAELETALVNYTGLAVCSANNHNTNLDEEPSYPAAYSLSDDPDLQNILTVGATGLDKATGDEKRGTVPEWKGSNYGKNSVHIFAPGTNILSTIPNNMYGYKSGTSMAAPFVAGAAGLLLSQFPVMTALELKKAIMNNADSLPELEKDPILGQRLCVTGGRLNVYNMLFNTINQNTTLLKTRDLPDGTIEITGANSFLGSTLTIPTYIDNKIVTAISARAFYGSASITSINIPDSVTRIGQGAFDGTAWYAGQASGIVYAGKVLYTYKGNAPASINDIANDTAGIADGAFYGQTALEGIELPYGVATVGSSAFFGCSGLESVILPESVTQIGIGAFSGCTSLTGIAIPDDIRNIGYGTFYNCESLEEVVLGSNSLLETIGYAAFYGCSSLTSIGFGDALTTIGYNAFKGCVSLADIGDPDNVTGLVGGSAAIGYYTFHDTAWYNDLEDGAVYIGKVLYAYKGAMPASTSLNIRQGTVAINEYAFYYSINLVNVTLPSGLTNIGYRAFYLCYGLTGVTIPTSVIDIGSETFGGCSGLTEIIFAGNNTLSLGPAAFKNCRNLINISIPASIKSLNETFHSCVNLEEVIFEADNTLEFIGDNTFIGCASLENIAIPSSVKAIGAYAFARCGLTNIILSSSITDVRESAFSDCANLSTVNMQRQSPPALGINAFNSCSGDLVINVPNKNSMLMYRSATGWSVYASRITYGGIPPHIAEYEIHEFAGSLDLYEMLMYEPAMFVIRSTCGGTYSLYTYLRDFNDMLLLQYDATTETMVLVQSYEDEDGYIIDTIDLEEDVYYLIVISSEPGHWSSIPFELRLIG